MRITDVRVRKVSEEGKMKAVVSVTFDDEFVVHDIKIIEGQNGLFVAMPSRKMGEGDFRDIAHPLTSETRNRIKDAIFADGSVVPCGMGDGSLPEILDIMARRADGMVLSIEPHLTVFDGLKGLQDEEVKHKFVYESNRAAFAAAADALKETLKKIGFGPLEGSKGTWIK